MGRASSGLPWELGRGLAAMCGGAPKDLLWWSKSDFSTATCGSAICSDDLRWSSVELVFFHFCIPNGSMSIPSYQVRFKAILLTKSQQSCLVLLCVTTWLCLLFLLTQLACQTVLQCRSCLEE